jgi:transcriptional regulator with XRE-family HTH domain
VEFDIRLGEHLRRVRQQKRLSLLDVEAASGKEFKASVVGAYERGERAISVRRLARLADLYGVPPTALLPKDDGDAPDVVPLDRGVAIDVSRLQHADTREGKVMWRYVQALQSERGDWAGRVLTVRRDDLRALASVLDTSTDRLLKRLEELGVRSSG